MLVGEVSRPHLNLRIQLQRLLHHFRHALHLPGVQADHAPFHTAALSDREPQQTERGELGGEGLGAGDADFGPGARHQAKIGFAYQ